MSRHSNDLRQRVISFYHKKGNKLLTSITFSVSRPTIDSWIELDKKEKLFEIKEYTRGRISRVNLKKLKRIVDNHPDMYFREIAQYFPVKRTQIQNLIKDKLGYTLKKNEQSTKRLMKIKKEHS
ncbi:hypothetical protein HC766_05330 [Candidatus Gracilibacteria bacterium]|nr:hypothetical protein [Candidatus Gracilibacteria bacterium]NJS41731.1 hypothetical protein [Candidatus Gracilibacteria bacterium]